MLVVSVGSSALGNIGGLLGHGIGAALDLEEGHVAKAKGGPTRGHNQDQGSFSMLSFENLLRDTPCKTLATLTVGRTIAFESYPAALSSS